MASFNRVILVGNLTRDSEIRHTPGGVAVLTFGIAVNTKVGKNEDGSPIEDTMFIDVVVFGKLAEATAEYLKKGKLVLVEGRIRYRTWEDASGNKRSKHEVITANIQFLSSKNGKADETPEIPEEAF